jgi:2-polyprenyl-3-methyl-5-hydroxy-6-metoxy-1,4-benzoquinol methylase
MFLSHRATQAEYLDLPGRTQVEIGKSYEALASVNRFFVFAEPFQRPLPKWLGPGNCRSLSLLDLGAGDGSLGALLTRWAAEKQGWDWRFTNLDVSVPALRLNQSGANVAGSALALPFRDGSFDVVIASQMTHHLTRDDEVIQHLCEAWRVARRAIFFSDLHRGPVLYGMLWLLLQLRRFPKSFNGDALLSVRRGFRTGELRQLAGRAGIPAAKVWLYYGSRVIVQAKKI